MTMMSATANIQLCTTDEIKSLIAEAAEASGLDITQFVLERVIPEAREIVATTENRIELSEEDWDAFKTRLDEPPKDLRELKAFLNQKPKFW